MLKHILFGVALALAATCVMGQDSPYGTSNFSSYADIDSLKQLKVVYDFNFVDPKAVGVALNSVGALLKATADFGPHEIDPLKVVVVMHGPELALFAKVNYPKYKEIVDRAASFAQQGVRFEACRNSAAAQGFSSEEFHGFVHVVPAGPLALAYWQAKGYSLNAPGATMPTPPISAFNIDDIRKK
jgi:hypothetical protein